MKKVFVILFILIILLSGMNFSIAEHFCGGKIAAVKWSFASEKATCGMEKSTDQLSFSKKFTTNCCQNNILYFAVDKIFIDNFYHLKCNLDQIHVFSNLISLSYNFSHAFAINVKPPGILSGKAHPANICILRI